MSAIRSFRGQYRWLSNFWPVKIVWVGITYPSVENAYQAAKTSDWSVRERIAVMTPAQAKQAGREVALREGWDKSRRIRYMEMFVRLKFQDSSLREKLLATGERELVEGNAWGDVFWGVYAGTGRNELGRILMRTRAWLRRQA